MKAALKRGTAGRDECCAYCGYPFDEGDWLWDDGNGNAFCSKGCGLDFAAIQKREVRA